MDLGGDARAPFPMPWDTVAAPALESLTAAAARLGLSVSTLRGRARRCGLLGVAPVGRPPAGTALGLPRAEWDRVAPPAPPRSRVPLGRLQATTGHDWRIVLARCYALGETVTVDAPGGRSVYTVTVAAAERVTASFLRGEVETLRGASARTGVPLDRLRAWLRAAGLRSEGDGRRKARLIAAEVDRVVKARRAAGVGQREE